MINTLIVDDEELSRTVMEEIISRYGRHVSVSNGRDAVKIYAQAMAKNRRFDLVLLDISMDDISGLEVLKQIRALEKARTGENRTIVAMVTAHGEKNVVIDCIRAGCKGYFIKPLKQAAVDKKLLELGFSPLKQDPSIE